MTGLTGTGQLVRVIIRHDRLVLAAWIAVIVVVGVGTVAYYAQLFATPEARAGVAADVAATPALLAFNGPLLGDSLDVMATWRMRDLSYTLISVMTLMTTIRHSRAEEDSGRQELVGAAVIGRHAALTASLIVAIAAGVVAALLVAAGMIGLGLAPAGALGYAAAASATGAVFAGVGAVTAQLAASGRGALGLGASALGLSYLMRFAADGSGSTALAWGTPLGWAHKVRPFAGESWAVLTLPVAVAVVLIGLAHLLLSRRDFAAGILPDRAGRPVGRIASASGLAWRQQRGMLLAWTAVYAVAGAFFGALVAAVRNAPAAIGDSPVLRGFLDRYAGAGGASGPDVFLWVIALTLGYTAALYPALVVARVRAEEAGGRAELLLSTPATRVAWAGSHAIIAALGTVVLLAAGGLTTGLAFAGGSGGEGSPLPALAATLLQAPAAWVLGGVTLLTLGLVPRATAAVAWAGFLFVQLFELVGPLAGIDFRIVEWVVPYFHLPRILTGDAPTPWPVLALAAVTLALGSIGIAALSRRDLAPTS